MYRYQIFIILLARYSMGFSQKNLKKRHLASDWLSCLKDESMKWWDYSNPDVQEQWVPKDRFAPRFICSNEYPNIDSYIKYLACPEDDSKWGEKDINISFSDPSYMIQGNFTNENTYWRYKVSQNDKNTKGGLKISLSKNNILFTV